MFLSWGGLETQEDPGQLGGPGGACADGAQRILQAAVKPLHHPVGLWMVGSCRLVSDLCQKTK